MLYISNLPICLMCKTIVKLIKANSYSLKRSLSTVSSLHSSDDCARDPPTLVPRQETASLWRHYVFTLLRDTHLSASVIIFYHFIWFGLVGFCYCYK